MNSRFRAVTASVLMLALFMPPVVFSSSADKKQTVRTTAYTHSEADHLKYGRKTAMGSQLKRSTSYTSAAADWSRYPVGTTFRMKGSGINYVIDDYGSALVGTDTIDIYHTSKSAMNHWGVRHVDIEITKWGDYEKSREILSQRTKYQHCRQMYAAIPDADTQRESKRGWFWNRKAKDSAPAPAPAATPQPEPQRAPDAPLSADMMLASNDKKSFGLRHWMSGRDADDTAPATAPQPEIRTRPTAPVQPQPEIERTQPEHSDLMLAANETIRSENRWQWLRKVVGRDTATEPITAPEIPAPSAPTYPQFIEEQPDVNIMLASNTSAPAPATAPTPQRSAVSVPTPTPTPTPATQHIPAPTAPAPAPAAVVLASAKVETSRPAPASISEPIAIARTNSSTAVKVAHNSEAAGQRVIFAIARPDSAVPHRKREVRALPAGWKP